MEVGLYVLALCVSLPAPHGALQLALQSLLTRLVAVNITHSSADDPISGEAVNGDCQSVLYPKSRDRGVAC